MKLWKAIVKGSKYRPQCGGDFFGLEGGSCALGAAVEGIVGPNFGGKEAFARSIYMATKETYRVCPKCKETMKPYGHAIAHVNDLHGWSREAIAEWVKTIEDKQTKDKWEARKLSRLQIANNNSETANETKVELPNKQQEAVGVR